MSFRSRCSHAALCLMAVFLCMPQAKADESIGNSTWSVERKTDPILDTTNITARLRETGVKKSLFGDGKFLIVRCRERKLDAIIVWGSYGALGFSLLENQDTEVVVRFDSTAAKTENWPKSTNYNATFAPEVESFVQSLSMHQKLAVRTFPKEGGSLTAVFDLSEAKPILKEVTAACRE